MSERKKTPQERYAAKYKKSFDENKLFIGGFFVILETLHKSILIFCAYLRIFANFKDIKYRVTLLSI